MVYRPNAVKALFLLALSLAVGLAGCSKVQSDNNDSGDASGLSPQQLRSLVQQDLSGILTIDQAGPATADDDQHLKGAITAVFGGTSGTDFHNFYQSRISVELYGDEEYELVNNPPVAHRHQGWDQAGPSDHAEMFGAANGGDSNSKIETVALNVGLALWFQSLLDSTSTTLVVNGTPDVLDLANHGIMELGKGYKTTIQTTSGATISLPAAYRQGILLHEARHSDCTGGITQADLNVARGAANVDEFDQKFTHRSCGHMHVRCDSGTYEGAHACDNEPWGAYTVGGLYMIGMIRDADPATEDADVLRALATDALSRVQGFEISDVIDGKYGKPDMTSQGVIDHP